MTLGVTLVHCSKRSTSSICEFTESLTVVVFPTPDKDRKTKRDMNKSAFTYNDVVQMVMTMALTMMR